MARTTGEGEMDVVAEAPAIDEQRETIRGLIDKATPKTTKVWSVVDYKWYDNWQRHVNWGSTDNGPDPGAIDNTPLLIDPSDTNKLKPERRENYDHVLIPQEAYKLLVKWYGGGPQIDRRTIPIGVGQNYRVDLYPLALKEVKSKQPSQPPTTVYFSRDATVHEVVWNLASTAKTAPHKCRLWIKQEDWELQTNARVTLGELGVEDGHMIYLEKEGHEGWPEDNPRARAYASFTNSPVVGPAGSHNDVPVGTVTYSSATGANARTGASAVDSTYGRPTAGGEMSSYLREKYKNTEGSTIEPGLCGLSNLGNTCFMNSALQCLSNSVPMTNHFISGDFKADINRNNPLGSKGFLADYYGALMKELWSSKFRVVSPTSFKQVLGRFAPQFSGYQQHDSQELLAFLLDGLHEDLNRVLVKPYVESVESNGRPDAVVAEEAWQAHLKRNQSIIVDLFQGQFKSTVVCPVCDRVSITFDPFMYLSVPLPIATERTLEVIVMFADRTPRRFALKVPINGDTSDIKKAISRVTHLGLEQQGICDVYWHKLCKILPLDYPIKSIRDCDQTYCFEIMPNDKVVYAIPGKAEERKLLREQERQDRKRRRQELREKKRLAKEAEPMETEKSGEAVKEEDVEMKDEGDAKDKGKELKGDDADISSDEEGFPKPKALRKDYSMRYITTCHRELQQTPLRSTRKFENFGHPFVVSVDLNFITHRELYDKILDQVKKIFGTSQVEEESKEEKEAKLEKAAAQVDTLSPEELRGLHGPEGYPFTLYLNTAYTISPGSLRELPVNDAIVGNVRDSNVMFVLDWTDEGVRKYYNKKAVVNDESMETLKKDKKKSLPLSDCLGLFTKQEKLSAEDAWYCSKCQEHREATKKFDLWKLPKLLVVHLKRFHFTKTWREKLETVVDFPQDLDMSPYVAGTSEIPPMYKLYAVSNHSGSMGFGHYTAYGKNKNNGKWYNFNDSSVSEASESDIVSNNAYLLFYERQDLVDTRARDVDYSPEEVEKVYQSAKEEIEKELKKEREKATTWMSSQASRRMASGIGAAGPPTRLDDIDDGPGGRVHGPHLPFIGNKGKELAIVPEPMDVATTAANIAAGQAGYMSDEEEQESTDPARVAQQQSAGHFDPAFPGGVNPVITTTTTTTTTTTPMTAANAALANPHLPHHKAD